MRIVILGQPRTGKTTLAGRLSDKYSIPVYHTDMLRRELGYHLKNVRRFGTEIDIDRQKNFYDDVLKTIPKDNYILEGSAIYPCDVFIFKPDAFVMLSAVDRDLDQMVKMSRLYDTENAYTRKYDDNALKSLFKSYKDFERHWVHDYKDVVPIANTSNYIEGIKKAEEIISEQLKQTNTTETLKQIISTDNYSFNGGSVYLAQ